MRGDNRVDVVMPHKSPRVFGNARYDLLRDTRNLESGEEALDEEGGSSAADVEEILHEENHQANNSDRVALAMGTKISFCIE